MVIGSPLVWSLQPHLIGDPLSFMNYKLSAPLVQTNRTVPLGSLSRLTPPRRRFRFIFTLQDSLFC